MAEFEFEGRIRPQDPTQRLAELASPMAPPLNSILAFCDEQRELPADQVEEEGFSDEDYEAEKANIAAGEEGTGDISETGVVDSGMSATLYIDTDGVPNMERLQYETGMIATFRMPEYPLPDGAKFQIVAGDEEKIFSIDEKLGYITLAKEDFFTVEGPTPEPEPPSTLLEELARYCGAPVSAIAAAESFGITPSMVGKETWDEVFADEIAMMAIEAEIEDLIEEMETSERDTSATTTPTTETGEVTTPPEDTTSETPPLTEPETEVGSGVVTPSDDDLSSVTTTTGEETLTAEEAPTSNELAGLVASAGIGALTVSPVVGVATMIAESSPTSVYSLVIGIVSEGGLDKSMVDTTLRVGNFADLRLTENAAPVVEEDPCPTESSADRGAPETCADYASGSLQTSPLPIDGKMSGFRVPSYCITINIENEQINPQDELPTATAPSTPPGAACGGATLGSFAPGAFAGGLSGSLATFGAGGTSALPFGPVVITDLNQINATAPPVQGDTLADYLRLAGIEEAVSERIVRLSGEGGRSGRRAPRSMWANVIPCARWIMYLRQLTGFDIVVFSAFRENAGQHGDFRALDTRAELNGSAVAYSDWVDYMRLAMSLYEEHGRTVEMGMGFYIQRWDTERQIHWDIGSRRANWAHGPDAGNHPVTGARTSGMTLVDYIESHPGASASNSELKRLFWAMVKSGQPTEQDWRAAFDPSFHPTVQAWRQAYSEITGRLL
jgi:hypothetical protein